MNTTIEITRKGALYSAACAKCGCANFTHEWAHAEHNDTRDGMQNGYTRCLHCWTGRTTPTTFTDHGRKWYAGRIAGDDSSAWEYDTNKARLAQLLRAMQRDRAFA